MTGETPAIEAGSLALATRASGVCDTGERGVCYEVSTLGGRPGSSVLCERGRSDGFSPEDIARCLTITGEVCVAVADDPCTTVVRLQRDGDQGRCAAAFPPRLPAPLRNDATEDARQAQNRAVDTHLPQKGTV